MSSLAGRFKTMAAVMLPPFGGAHRGQRFPSHSNGSQRKALRIIVIANGSQRDKALRTILAGRRLQQCLAVGPYVSFGIPPGKLHCLLTHHHYSQKIRERCFLDLFDTLNLAVTSVCLRDHWLWLRH